MKILLTNDDGYFADGMLRLADQLRSLHDVRIVAPEEECSNCAHQVTAGRGLAIRSISEDVWAVNGWPADCVRVALKHLRLDVDMVIAGVNHGGNLGIDIVMSGTCAAAREAAIHGLPAIAISQVRKAGVSIDWQVTSARALNSIEHIGSEHPRFGGFWNINLPAIAPEVSLGESKRCLPDPSPLIVHYEHSESNGLLFKSDYHNRPRLQGRDVEYCFQGNPTISFIAID